MKTINCKLIDYHTLCNLYDFFERLEDIILNLPSFSQILRSIGHHDKDGYLLFHPDGQNII